MKKIEFNNLNLKTIALITMIIDHVGAIFFPQIIWFRLIGRIAFPLYAFMIVEGFLHTKNIKKYIAKLAILAIITEVIFDISFYGNPIYLGHQNILFTLLLGLLCLFFYEQKSKNGKDGFYVILITCVIAFILKLDYSFFGIITIFLFYHFRNSKKIYIPVLFYFTYVITVVILNCISNNIFNINLFIPQFGILLTIPLLLNYNYKKGFSSKFLSFSLYISYPLHLLILSLIKIFM